MAKAIGRYIEARGPICQSCQRPAGLDFHHKVRKSQLGQDTPENGLGLCRWCHTFIHAKRHREDFARECGASLFVGEPIDWPESIRVEIVEERRRAGW